MTDRTTRLRICALLAAISLLAENAGAQVTGRVSVSSAGIAAVGGHSVDPSVSDDGRLIAFASAATNLVGDDTNGASDVFVHDRDTGVTRLVSRSTAGAVGNAASLAPKISADGTTIAFVSSSTNLVAGAAVPSAYVHDVATGTTSRISPPANRVVNTTSRFRGAVALDATGRHVALSIKDPASISLLAYEVLIVDRQSTAMQTVVGMHGSLSADGRILAYDLIDASRSQSQVVILDREVGGPTVVDVAAAGAADCRFPVVSGDGHWVAFECQDLPDLGAYHQGAQIYLHNRQTGLTSQISNAPGVPGYGHSLAPDITPDGRYVVFNSLTPLTGHPIVGNQIFRYDRLASSLTLLSTSTAGEALGSEANVSFTPTVSADGQTVAFASAASHFVVGDTNASDDVYILDPGCGYALSTTSIALPSVGGTVPLAVSTSPECAWVARSPQNWITLATPAGLPGAIGSSQLSFTAGINSTGAARSVVVSVAGRAVAVTQAAVSCTVNVSSDRPVAPASGTTGRIDVTTNYSFCGWTAVSDAPWLTPSPLSGTGSRQVLFIVPANTAPGPRSGTITIAGTPIVFTQSGTACTFGVNPGGLQVPASGASGSIAIAASPAGCPWANFPGSPWITIAPLYGIGPGTVAYQVLPNTTGAARTGDVTIANYAVQVSQSASTGPIPPIPPVPPVPPGAPGLSVTVVGNAVTLQWSPPSSGPAPTGYTIEAGSAPGLSNLAVAPTGSTATSLALSAPNGTYFVRVRATFPQGSSPPSNEVIVQVGCAAPPAAPLNLLHSVMGAQVSLSWNAANGATAYLLQAGSAAGSSNLASATVAGTAIVAQAPPGIYFVRVRGQNLCGVGAASNEAIVTVGGGSLPGAPSGLAFAVDGHAISLTWSAPTTGGPTIGYVLEAGSATGLVNLAQVPLGSTLSVAATGVPSGTYYVRVRGVNSIGIGPASNEVIVVIH